MPARAGIGGALDFGDAIAENAWVDAMMRPAKSSTRNWGISFALDFRTAAGGSLHHVSR